MKIKESNFADYACILPIAQPVIGIPIVLYHSVRVLRDLFLEIFFSERIKESNECHDNKISDYKLELYTCYTVEEWSVDKKQFFYSFTKNSLQSPLERPYNSIYDRIQLKQRIKYERSCKTDSVARLSELGFAIIRCIPVFGSFYSFYVYSTSTIYHPLIPNFGCGGSD